MKILKGFFSIILVLIISFSIIEIVTRVFFPIFPGVKKLSIDGEQELQIQYVQSGVRYRQFSEEYDAVTTITKDGYRVPEVKTNPEIIFLGDSFTFGQGLSDEETFVQIFCNQHNFSCANLGVPGASTVSEVERLQKYLTEYKWKPKVVILFMLVMTDYVGAGNDLFDNIRDFKGDSYIKKDSNIKSSNQLYKMRQVALKYSNLVRVIKYYFSPLLKKNLSPETTENVLNKALKITEDQLAKFSALKKHYGFEFKVVLLYPVQDILRGSYESTFKNIKSITEERVYSTGSYFIINPSQYYFPLDGHLNYQGSLKIVDFLNDKFLSEINSYK